MLHFRKKLRQGDVRTQIGARIKVSTCLILPICKATIPMFYHCKYFNLSILFLFMN